MRTYTCPGCGQTGTMAPVGRNRVWCSDRCRSAHRKGPRTAPSCHGWPAIRRTLEACGEASVAMLALEVYGDESPANLRAMHNLLAKLGGYQVRSTSYYRGGPWVTRTRRGWYALPDDAGRAPSPAAMVRALKERPRTVEDLARKLRVAPATVYLWLRDLRAGGQLRQEVAPRWRWPGPRTWVYWYFVGATAARKAASSRQFVRPAVGAMLRARMGEAA